MRAGLRKLEHRTSVPISTRSVTAATALTIVQASCMPSIGPFAGSLKKWSNIHTESRPRASAAKANDRIAGQPGVEPSPSTSAAGITTPTFTRGLYEEPAGDQTPIRSRPGRQPSAEREDLLPSPGGPFFGRREPGTFEDLEENIRVERLADVLVRTGLEGPEPVRGEGSS